MRGRGTKAQSSKLAQVGRVLSITEEFYDPHYPFLPDTIRRVENAGFRLEERFGNLWVYTANFRKAD